MSIHIFIQQRRNFKAYYCQHVCVYWRSAFSGLVSYQRFVEWMPSTLLPLCVYLKHWFGTCSGISFIDSSSLKVCHNRRIQCHKVFRDLAARGKTSVDWFLGLMVQKTPWQFQNENVTTLENSMRQSKASGLH